MDILKKMFQQNDEEKNRKEDNSSSKDEFRKPQWFEENKTEDELFGDDRNFVFQVFTNPTELQKHFETQMEQLLQGFSTDEGGFLEKNLKEEFLKPGFESGLLEEFKKQNKQNFDTDLDGEIFTDQLYSLIQRFANGGTLKETPQIAQDGSNGNILPRNDNKTLRKSTPKMTDEEIIMGRIHGTLDNENQERHKPASFPRFRSDFMNLITPIVPRSGDSFGSTFNGNFQGPKMFSQSVMTKTIRKSDGTYETTKIVQDSQGNKTTTITRQKDGKPETVTIYSDDIAKEKNLSSTKNNEQQLQQVLKFERNMYVSKNGFVLPKNLW